MVCVCGGEGFTHDKIKDSIKFEIHGKIKLRTISINYVRTLVLNVIGRIIKLLKNIKHNKKKSKLCTSPKITACYNQPINTREKCQKF